MAGGRWLVAKTLKRLLPSARLGGLSCRQPNVRRQSQLSFTVKQITEVALTPNIALADGQ
jgi:hypothetical protein